MVDDKFIGMGEIFDNRDQVFIVMPFAGTVAGVAFEISDATSGSNGWKVEVLQNAGLKTMTCTIDQGDTKCTSTDNTFTFIAGDSLSVRVMTVGSTTIVATGTASLHITSTP